MSRPPNDGALSTARIISLVAGRELRERLQSKSFYALTGVMVVGILAVGVTSRVVGDSGSDPVEVGVSDPAPEDLAVAIPQVAELFDRPVTVTSLDGGSAARQALEDGDVDVAVLGEEGQLLFEGDVDEELRAIVQQAWSGSQTRQSLIDEGLTPSRADEVLSPAPLETLTLEDDSEPEGLALLVGTVAAVLLFGVMQTFGNHVLVGVVEEKSTAVVELLLARARADQLLAGKVIGIGAAALLQFSLALLAGVVSLGISGAEVPGEIWTAVPLMLAWFLGGYTLYTMLYALAGSLVSRQEDAQAAAMPVVTVLIVSYALVFVFGYMPESTASTVLSLLPPTSPFMMPMRMVAGAASVVEVVAAVALLFGATLVMWKLAGRIYEQVLLRRGSRIAWNDVLRLLRD